MTLASGLTWLSTQARITPFVVEVDRAGQAVAFGPAERLRKADERVIRYQLGMLVHDLRTVLTDQEAQKEMLTRSYAHSRGPAVAFLNEWFSHQNPFERSLRSRVDVQVQSILPLSGTTWQVQWIETLRSPGGKSVETETWQAILTVELDPPETTQALLVNPLGLFITEISWAPTL